ncbi:hypothetical protein [Actinoalloteichus caeruleus]|uniref:hypothetical protein n=1 Tax=Actinoalloteichus cyanogriseus TaxID=2893586 RepID=UPI0012DEBEAF|nr:hypothetical protein [Actinoalloteichus caeruleus]
MGVAVNHWSMAVWFTVSRYRFPNEYGLANKVEHPRNVYLAERDLLGPLDDWLSRSFAPHRISDTVDALCAAQREKEEDPVETAAARLVGECDRALRRHRAALEAGADARLVAEWIAETQARRAEALSRSTTAGARRVWTGEELHAVLEEMGDLRSVLGAADLTTRPRCTAVCGSRPCTTRENELCGSRRISTRTVGVIVRVRGGT